MGWGEIKRERERVSEREEEPIHTLKKNNNMHTNTKTQTHLKAKNMIEINRAFLHTGRKMRNATEKKIDISVSIMQ